MPLEIRDIPFEINGSRFTMSVDTPLRQVFNGMIVRVFNSGSTTQNYTYTNTYLDTVTVNVPASGSVGNPLYVLAASSSAVDSYNGVTSIVETRLFITGSTLGSAFTEQIITTVGSGSWTKPDGVTEVVVECWGGGGAGGGTTVTNNGGGGGAGGQHARRFISYPSAQQSVSYVLGAGGIGVVGNGPSGSSTTWNSTQVIAVGGAGGELGNALTGNGGVGSTVDGVGDVVYAGGSGGAQIVFSAGGPAGSGAGSSQNGNPATDGPVGPGSQAYEYGGAGANGPFTAANGSPGNNYGGGGSGGYKPSGPNRSGGNGAQGLIRLIYR